MTAYTKSAFLAAMTALLNDNTAGEISAADVRGVITDFADSLAWPDDTLYGQLDADYTLANQTAAQRIFNFGAAGALAVPTGRFHLTMGLYMSGMSTTSGNATVTFGGTATADACLLKAYGHDGGSTAAQAESGSTWTSLTTSNEIVNAGVGTTMAVILSGMVNFNAAGTLIPTIALTTASAAVVKKGSFIMLRPMGPTSSLTQGTWS